MRTVTVAPSHQGEPQSQRPRPGGPCGRPEQSLAVTPGFQAVAGEGGCGVPRRRVPRPLAQWEPDWPLGPGTEGQGGPFCHLAEHGLFRFTRGLCEESRRLFLIRFISTCLESGTSPGR